MLLGVASTVSASPVSSLVVDSLGTNQYGLTMDTVTTFELVLPNGTLKGVTEKGENLWFALRGGFNNYGIVTRFTLRTHKQDDVWGALLAFAGDQIKPPYTAFSKWTSVEHDCKGVQLADVAHVDGTIEFQMVLFYDVPKPPEGFYDELLNIPSSAKAVIEGDFLKFLSSVVFPQRQRTYIDGVPILHYSVPVIKATIDDVKALGDKLRKNDKDAAITFHFEPFEPDIFTHGGPSASPDRSRTIHPSAVVIAWNDKDLDEYVYDRQHTRSEHFDYRNCDQGWPGLEGCEALHQLCGA